MRCFCCSALLCQWNNYGNVFFFLSIPGRQLTRSNKREVVHTGGKKITGIRLTMCQVSYLDVLQCVGKWLVFIHRGLVSDVSGLTGDCAAGKKKVANSWQRRETLWQQLVVGVDRWYWQESITGMRILSWLFCHLPFFFFFRYIRLSISADTYSSP